MRDKGQEMSEEVVADEFPFDADDSHKTEYGSYTWDDYYKGEQEIRRMELARYMKKEEQRIGD